MLCSPWITNLGSGPTRPPRICFSRVFPASRSISAALNNRTPNTEMSPHVRGLLGPTKKGGPGHGSRGSWKPASVDVRSTSADVMGSPRYGHGWTWFRPVESFAAAVLHCCPSPLSCPCPNGRRHPKAPPVQGCFQASLLWFMACQCYGNR